MRTLRIDTEEGEKGRSFTVTMPSVITANELWSGGLTDTENIRPVLMTLVSSEQQLRFFVMNLRMGYKASIVNDDSYSRKKSHKLELLRTAGYKFIMQKNVDGQGSHMATVYLPSLIEPEPTQEPDPNSSSFLSVTTTQWYNSQRGKLSNEENLAIVKNAKKMIDAPIISILPDDEIVKMIPIAIRFIMYLDRRIPFPIISDYSFYLAIFLYFLANKLCSLSQTKESTNYYRSQSESDPWIWARSSLFKSFEEDNISSLGFMPSVAFKGDNKDIKKHLAEITALYIQNKK